MRTNSDIFAGSIPCWGCTFQRLSLLWNFWEPIMNPPLPDPVIDEIREIRHRISAMCDHDPAKLVAYLMQYQAQYRDRLVVVPVESSDETSNSSEIEANSQDHLTMRS